jgi:hypothetical protein
MICILKGVLNSGRIGLLSIGTAVLMIAAAANAAAIKQINCGSSSAASPYTADQYSSGGTTQTVTNTITISGITDPAPAAVYQSERYGTCSYTIPELTASTQYKVRLHFAELYQTAIGARRFNVVINGATVLSNFDVYATAGARFKAVLREFTVTSNSSGQIVINFNTIANNATIGGIEIISNATPPGETWVPDGDNGIKTLKNVGIVGPDWTHSGAEAIMYLGDQNHTIRACYGPNYPNGGGLVFQTLTAYDHFFKWKNTSGTSLMSLSAYTGNLDVSGQITAQSVKIGNWTLETPDYVFDETYKLRSLDEVEASIKANKHLPDVPSAAEMKKDGVDLSEMNMTLLKKVEELTLYVIEQNKKIESLEKRVSEK